MGGACVAVDGGQSKVLVRVSGVAQPIAVEGLGRLEGDLAEGLISRIHSALSGLQGGVPRIRRMVLGLTTMPATEPERLDLARRIAEAFSAAEVYLGGDALTAHAGAFGGAAGVVLTVGTGVACLGFDPATGDIRRVDGDGFLLGDAGAAFWIGSRGIEAVLRAADGRGGPTALSGACVLRFGEHVELAAHLHSLPRAVSAIAGFAVDVQAAAQSGDGVARAIIAEAADELVHTAWAASAVMTTRPVHLALSGRVVAPGTALRAAIEARLCTEPHLVIVPAAGDPLDGAWALVADLGGGAGGSAGQLRAGSSTAALWAAYDRHMTGWSLQ